MRKLAFLFFLTITNFSIAQNETPDPLLAKDIEQQTKWVDSVYQSMSIKERIGQLFTPMVFSSQDEKTHKGIIKLIKENKIGGLIFSKGGPIRQARLTNEYQAVSKLPLLIAMDAEWGLGMRLDSTYSFPWNMTLGAIKDTSLIRQVGRHIGEHCKRLGVLVNYAPVADINTNPNNPIIGNRSFGESRELVANHSLAFMKGLQDAGVITTGKHFPGHGDTEQDSHKTLPTISFNEKRIDSVELYPYRKLISNGLSSVMVAHLNIPSLETKNGFPSTLSKNIVTNILKGQLGFKGLVVTDALNMKGASNFSNSADVDLAAFKAGNDLLLISEDIPAGIDKLAEAYESGDITEERLSHSVKKFLKAKYLVGLNNYKPIGQFNLTEDLNRIEDDVLNEILFENAITAVKNEGDLLPLSRLETKKIAYVSLGDDDGSVFYKELKKYGEVQHVKNDNLESLISELNNYNMVVVGFHKSNESPWKSHKFKNKDLVWLYEIARTNNVILTVFTKPYALLDLKTTENFESILIAYQNSTIGQQKAAQAIFGGISVKGRLPVSAGNGFKVGDGLDIKAIGRLSYGSAEGVGISSEKLQKLDSVAQYAINSKMTPGIQLLVARKGKVVYNKNFGKHRYSDKSQVDSEDIYDVASLTKILATVPLLMELVEKGVISLDSKLSDLLPEYIESNKGHVTIKKMLSHYARLKPWIPFYTATLDSITNKQVPEYYSDKPSKEYGLQITKELYLRSDFQDSIQKNIKESELLSSLRYRYSDLPYYLLKKFIEEHYDQPLNELVQQHFYKSLGANYTTYNPTKKFDESNIVPSEVDDYFRFQEVHGFVHDMGAAMQNGVGGHAGVFSNANDVAKIMQMYLQKGYYGGKQYFKPETINKFNTCYYCSNKNRRGVGFDKPQLDEEGPTCGCVSMTSFGHSGFTGTYTWADPEEELVYVFMANRTYPKAGKNLLLREGIRTEIQRLIYEAIED